MEVGADELNLARFGLLLERERESTVRCAKAIRQRRSGDATEGSNW